MSSLGNRRAFEQDSSYPLLCSLEVLDPSRLLNGGAVPLLQENNIGHHFGPGVGLESVVGQTDRAQQVSPLRQILPHGGILCVHGVAAGPA